jgi:hypothetical protein
MWAEVTGMRDKKILVNFDNVVRIEPAEQDRWNLFFVDKTMSRVKIKATMGELNGLLSVRR